jgi:aminomethyltransferase
VTLADLAGATALVTVLGTRAPETLGAALGVDLAGLAPFHHRAAKAGRETALVVRAEDVGGRAFHVVVPAAARAELERCLAAVSVLDEYGWRTLRVASGVPEFGEDYGERTVAPELGMTDAISFTKGCYPGQEIVARVRTYGQAKRSLVRLRIAGGEVPARGTRIVDGSSEIGTVSSAGLLAGSVFALGFVHTGRDAPGTRLALADEAGGREVEVLPRAPEGGPA